MVQLTRIYTRGGDAGETSLGDGSRVAKHDPRIEALGAVDEANAAIGLCRLASTEALEIDAMLCRAQNDLFDLGADLCVPDAGPKSEGHCVFCPNRWRVSKPRSIWSMPACTR